MRRALKIIGWIVGVVIVLPIVAAAIVMLVANVDWGRRLIEQTVARLSDDRVTMTGLSGHFPDDLHLAHAALRDREGAWIIVDDLTLRWLPSRLLRKNAQIDLLRAGRVHLLRLPVSTSPEHEKNLPVRVDIDRFEVDRMEIGAPIA